jgi:hypothetical protein
VTTLTTCQDGSTEDNNISSEASRVIKQNDQMFFLINTQLHYEPG